MTSRIFDVLPVCAVPVSNRREPSQEYTFGKSPPPPPPCNKRARYLHQYPHRGLESAQRRVGGNIAIRMSLVFRISWNHIGVALLVDDPVITIKIGDGNCYPWRESIDFVIYPASTWGYKSASHLHRGQG